MYFDNDAIELKIKEFQETKNQNIIDELVPVFNKLITGVVGKYKLLRRNTINDDLAQEAWVGILEAINKWDKARGDAFSFFTAIVKNKIFWYLKNHYQDTSLDATEVLISSIDDLDKHLELIDSKETIEELTELRDYIKKLTLEDLDICDNEEYRLILTNFKDKFLGGDNIRYDMLIRETQKEIGVPKKKAREVLDIIYKHYMEDRE